MVTPKIPLSLALELPVLGTTRLVKQEQLTSFQAGGQLGVLRQASNTAHIVEGTMQFLVVTIGLGQMIALVVSSVGVLNGKGSLIWASIGVVTGCIGLVGMVSSAAVLRGIGMPMGEIVTAIVLEAVVLGISLGALYLHRQQWLPKRSRRMRPKGFVSPFVKVDVRGDIQGGLAFSTRL